MNYFTPAWHNGDIEDEDNTVYKKYKEYLAPLLPHWPPDVQILADRINLHDGLIRELLWDTNEAILFLRLRCGDLQVGYYDLDLHYSGVLLSPLDWGSLLFLKGDTKSEWRFSEALYDEVDEEDGFFVHHILFIKSRRARRFRHFRPSRSVRISRRGMVSRAKRKFRYYEIVIRFQQLRLATTPRASRFDASGQSDAGQALGFLQPRHAKFDRT
jgi:hypothetical protein